jgi:hypothetical protein
MVQDAPWHKLSAQKEGKLLRFRGWLRTDEEEIERRRERARVEPILVEPLEDEPVFGTFRTGSEEVGRELRG